MVSVIIPTFNRVDGLQRVLTAFEGQRPAELPFEVVVVDDGSNDGTSDVLAGWRSRRFRLRFARQTNGGPARARNRALEIAEGTIVLFGGDDIEPHPDLVCEHVREHDRRGDPCAAILGLTRWPEGGELTSTMRHIDGPGAQQFSYAGFADGAEYDFRHFYTSNVSVRRQLLDREPDAASFIWSTPRCRSGTRSGRATSSSIASPTASAQSFRPPRSRTPSSPIGWRGTGCGSSTGRRRWRGTTTGTTPAASSPVR